MDWHSPTDKKTLEMFRNFVRGMRRAMPVGGRVFWRSAALQPWYAEFWAREGFRVERLSARHIGTRKAIDGVNM